MQHIIDEVCDVMQLDSILVLSKKCMILVEGCFNCEEEYSEIPEKQRNLPGQKTEWKMPSKYCTNFMQMGDPESGT